MPPVLSRDIDFELKYDPNAAEQPKKTRCRKNNITWFNPPYNANVRTNVGAEFLILLDTCFPKNHPLYKIYNRNTGKITYRSFPPETQKYLHHQSQMIGPAAVLETPHVSWMESVCPRILSTRLL